MTRGVALYEGLIVRRWLKAPSEHLFASETNWHAILFPGYHRPLPAGLQQRVLERARRSGVEDRGEGLFLAAFAIVKANPAAYARLSTFLNIYGFCRNVSMASLIASACLLVGAVLGTAHTGSLVGPGWWAAGAFVLAVGLFYRYLKFFRQYAFEVFVTFGAPVRTDALD